MDNPDYQWYKEALFGRAPKGGCIDPLDGRAYLGGEFLPFYVPRPVMPQINEEDYPALLHWGINQGCYLNFEVVDPRKCKPHQRIDCFKASTLPDEVLYKPVLLSQDFYVLDGNHRWMAHMMLHDFELHAYVLPHPFEEAIDFLFSFPKTYELAT